MASTRSIEYCRTWLDRRHSLPYEIDGTVVKVDDLAQRRELGSTTHGRLVGPSPTSFRRRRRPRSSRGSWCRSGGLARPPPLPCSIPVIVGGAKVSLATLHNEDQVRIKDVRPGDTVVVRRAGDVIPEVRGPVLPLRPEGLPPWTFPTECPVCGEPLVRLSR